MKAINRYIIVDKIKTEPKKVAGLIMTDNTDVDNRYIKAKIISNIDFKKIYFDWVQYLKFSFNKYLSIILFFNIRFSWSY